MTSRTRYGILAFGIVLFLVAAPVIVLFVRGYRYDFSTRKFVHSGAISAYTNPNGAELSINGSDKGKTPKNVRFLVPGDYEISLTKDGYYPWSKRLGVSDGLVTSANLGMDNVTLFYTSPLITPIASDASGFFAGSKRLVFTTADHIYAADIGSPTRTSSLALGITASGPLQIAASEDENYFLVSSPDNSYRAVFSASNNTMTNLNTVLGTAKTSDMQFGQDGTLYALESGSLYAVDWRKKTMSQLASETIVGFRAHSDGIYALYRDHGTAAESLSLERIDPQTKQSAILYRGLPDWQTASIYLNQFNQPALIGNGDLYAIGSSTYAQQYVQSVQTEPGTSRMLYATNNELGLFDPGNGSIDVITRSSQPIAFPAVSLKTGWAFYISDGHLQATELDTRDRQNSYSLEKVGSDAQFSIDQNAQFVFLLDGDSLVRLQIR